MSPGLRRPNEIEAVLVAVVAVSAGLVALWGGATLDQVAIATLAGLVVGLALIAYIRSIVPSTDATDRDVERGRRR